jgi:hypothetical protein
MILNERMTVNNKLWKNGNIASFAWSDWGKP